MVYQPGRCPQGLCRPYCTPIAERYYWKITLVRGEPVGTVCCPWRTRQTLLYGAVPVGARCSEEWRFGYSWGAQFSLTFHSGPDFHSGSAERVYIRKRSLVVLGVQPYCDWASQVFTACWVHLFSSSADRKRGWGGGESSYACCLF